MDLITALFSVARNITDGEIDEVNKLHEKAKNQVMTYHSDMKGFKGLYVKIHKGWIFQLALIFVVPFFTTYLLGMKQKIMNRASGFGSSDNDEDGYEDEDEREQFEYLKSKFQ